MHTNKTTYYELPQFIGSDIVNDLTDTNGAYSAIDSAIHEVAEGVAAETEDIAGIKSQNGDEVLTTTAQTLSGAINELDDSINNASTGLAGKVAVNESDIASLQAVVGDNNSGLVKKVNSLEASDVVIEQDISSLQGSIIAINGKIGDEPLTTFAQDICGAINELNQTGTELAGKKIAIYGDSWSASSLPYHDWINVLNDATGLTAHVSAAGGYTIPQIYSQLWDSYNADIYIIMGGINDTMNKVAITQVSNSLKNLIDSIRSINGNAEIFVVTPAKQLTPSNSAAADYYVPFELYRQVIWSVASAKQVKVISGLKATDFTIDTSTDGLHPNTSSANLAKIGKWILDGILRGGDSRDFTAESVTSTNYTITQNGCNTEVYNGSATVAMTSGQNSFTPFSENFGQMAQNIPFVSYYAVSNTYYADMMCWIENVSGTLTFNRKILSNTSETSVRAFTTFTLKFAECL